MSRAVPRRPIDKLSIALLVAMHLACVLALFVPFSWGVVLLALGGYVLRMFAITAGYHRYFSHRAFKTSRAFQFVLAALGTASMQNGPLWWASWHRHHHKHSDTALDAHSPRHGGFWTAHMGWVFDGAHDAPVLANVKDLARYPELRFLERHKWIPLVVYALGCLAIGGWSGVVWGFAVSTVALFHGTLLINSLAHVWGSRPFATADDSRNNALLAVITLGEGWHNNHHHYMSSARQGFRPWQIDVTYYALKVLSWLGIVWDLRPPPADALAGRATAARRPETSADPRGRFAEGEIEDALPAGPGADRAPGAEAQSSSREYVLPRSRQTAPTNPPRRSGARSLAGAVASRPGRRCDVHELARMGELVPICAAGTPLEGETST
jgi:stearoyl-CoA desaturase (Delta-9 desaturase)